ncbi:Mothers against decapentaplegic-like protein 6 [Armadillidium nasatum]|uniref:Mothers against decapentaplegic-like protein 6 n=1 Tax=Armadillidium nasatum TaxID=96803 RepID=A0A5N5TDB9_9CRUS|nr:Mothers against decapentaplegic-like protein 6 [Armadillidium nasatum]
MQCFPCLGSRSQDDITDCGSRNSSYKLASHLVYKKERIAKGESRFTEGPPLCPSHPPTEPPTSLFSDSSLTLSSRTRSKRNADGLAPYDQPCNEPCNQTPEGSGVDLPCDDRLQDTSNFCSVETGGGSSHGRGDSPWCKLLYWEENEIRSRVFNVWDPAINVLGDTPHGSGWSLSTFFNTPAKTEKISRVRAKICQGLILWREGKAVWVYNRSKTPVYLNSASLDGTFFNLNLYKCPPGYAMIIYYYEMARELMGRLDYKLRRKCDTTDVNSVRISFAKGWGKDYHRRQILCCPCWIEVHVVPTLKIEQRAPHR